MLEKSFGAPKTPRQRSENSSLQPLAPRFAKPSIAEMPASRQAARQTDSLPARAPPHDLDASVPCLYAFTAHSPCASLHLTLRLPYARLCAFHLRMPLCIPLSTFPAHASMNLPRHMLRLPPCFWIVVRAWKPRIPLETQRKLQDPLLFESLRVHGTKLPAPASVCMALLWRSTWCEKLFGWRHTCNCSRIGNVAGHRTLSFFRKKTDKKRQENPPGTIPAWRCFLTPPAFLLAFTIRLGLSKSDHQKKRAKIRVQGKPFFQGPCHFGVPFVPIFDPHPIGCASKSRNTTMACPGNMDFNTCVFAQLLFHLDPSGSSTFRLGLHAHGEIPRSRPCLRLPCGAGSLKWREKETPSAPNPTKSQVRNPNQKSKIQLGNGSNPNLNPKIRFLRGRKWFKSKSEPIQTNQGSPEWLNIPLFSLVRMIECMVLRTSSTTMKRSRLNSTAAT